MRHDWKTEYRGLLSLVAHEKRKCTKCGAIQEYQDVHYDRLTGVHCAWRPLVGRCTLAKRIAFKP